jgi:membrane protein implicated in regulation of membrane protease activity
VTTLKKYALFQVPGWVVAAVVLLGLMEWINLSPWAASGLFALWVVKDIALYPLVRIAYEADVKTGMEQLVGEKGVAQEWLDPDGMVRIGGELWQAEAEPSEQRIEPNSEIRVTGAHNLTLVVSRKATPASRRTTRLEKSAKNINKSIVFGLSVKKKVFMPSLPSARIWDALPAGSQPKTSSSAPVTAAVMIRKV